MGRRNDHSREEIHDLALEAAEKIVIEQGLSGLSARKAAAAIGYTVGSLYLVYKNLDDLILQINAHTLDDLYKDMVRAKVDCTEPESCILTLGQAYLCFATEQQNRWRTIFEYLRPDDPAVPDWYQERITRLFSLVEAPLSQIMGTQDVQACAQAARALWSSVHGVCILALTGKLGVAGVDSAGDLLDLLISTYLTGLKNS